MKNPLLAPALAFVAGILLARGVGFTLWEIPVEFALFAALACVARGRLRYACVLTSALFAGVFADVWGRLAPAPSIDAGARETVRVEGCVVEPSVFNQNRDQFTLELAPGARARVTITLDDGETAPRATYGRRVEVLGKVRAIRNFNNPGSFDYITYSARRQIYWTVAARSSESIRMLPGACGSTFLRAIFALRTAALDRIDRLYANDSYSTAMMESILIGDSTKLEKVWTDHFRRTGTFHALVISGLHITVLAGALLFLLRLCFVREIPALIATAIATWIYVLVAGWIPPAVRAAAGFTVFLVGKYFYRQRRVMNLLALVGIVYLAADPGQMFEASFQLSFLSVAAIAVLAGPIIDRTSGRYRSGLHQLADPGLDLHLAPRVAQFRIELRLLAETLSYFLRLKERWLLHAIGLALRAVFFAFELVVISAVMQVGLALPMAIYFHRISFTGVSANVLIVPLLSAVVPIGFLAVFTGWTFAAHLAGWLLVASEHVANWHVRWEPGLRIPDPPLWLSIAFSAALFGLVFTLGRSRAWRYPTLAIVAALFTLVVWHPFPPRIQPRDLELTAIDVGQGDSLLVAFPTGKLMLVDAGGILAFGRRVKPRLDIGEDVVSTYLWSRSIRHLDAVVLTHAHEDHAGGLPAVIDNFHPPVMWTGAHENEPVWNEVSRHARERGVKIVEMHAGQAFDYGGARIEILSPPADYIPDERRKNNDSLAFRVTYGSRSFLLSGDMEKAMESRLIADGLPARSDVLKVCHHGSKTSSSELFLDAVRPAFAVISDGFENSFGHPHRDVLGRLAARRAEILRTDTAGLITIRTDGRRISVATPVAYRF